jgi:hypothetical protein
MQLHRLLLGLALASATTAAAGPAARIDEASLKTAAWLRDTALAANEAYPILESLTTEVGARMAGSPADARAVAWASAKFHELKFDQVYTELVTFPRWRRGRESAEVLAPFPHRLAVTALGGSVGTGDEPLEGELVEYANLEALKSARVDDVRGKIVFIGNRMERTRSGAGYGPAQAARKDGADVAARLGAKAVLIRSIGTDSERTPHTGMGVDREAALADAAAAKLPRTESGIPIVATPIPAAAVSNPDADLLQHLFERGKPVVVRLELDCGYAGEYTSANVIGEITGSERPKEFVLIGGHLDSWDLGTGAVDDGAGVAITMAAAQLLVKTGKRPRRSVRVVAFANEEQGLWGGHAYAAKHAGDAAKFVLTAESDLGADRIYALDAKVRPEALGAIEQLMQVLAPLGIERGAASPGGGPDTRELVKHGVATVELRQDATRYFDLHHTASDTLDKVELQALSQNVAAYVVLAYLAAQADVAFGPIAATPNK